MVVPWLLIFVLHDERGQAGIAAICEQDKEDHGGQSPTIILARCFLRIMRKAFEQPSYLLSTAPRRGSDTVSINYLLQLSLGILACSENCLHSFTGSEVYFYLSYILRGRAYLVIVALGRCDVATNFLVQTRHIFHSCL